MELKELVKLDSQKVRRDSNLMRLYINYFKDAFSFEPNCAGCTFSKDFKKLKNYVQNNNNKIIKKAKMETTFKIKRKYLNKIFTYKKKGGNIIFRIYGKLMNEEFAVEYLKNKTKEDLKTKKTYFELLPLQFREKTKANNKEEKKEPKKPLERKKRGVKAKTKE